jgi:hypothetical protein
MGENTQTKKSSKKILVATVIIAVIIVAAVAGVYYGTQPSATAAEKGFAITNFRDGAWANYSVVYYDLNGEVVCPGSMLTYTYAGQYNNRDCWVYVENTTWTQVNGTGSDIFTYYLDKTSYVTLYQTVDSYANGTHTNTMGYTSEAEGLVDNLSIFSSLSVKARDKSVTVPAGTFSTTEQDGPVTYVYYGESYGLHAYVNNTVPGWGIVEYQYYTMETMTSDYQLVSYGS